MPLFVNYKRLINQVIEEKGLTPGSGGEGGSYPVVSTRGNLPSSLTISDKNRVFLIADERVFVLWNGMAYQSVSGVDLPTLDERYVNATGEDENLDAGEF